MLQRRPFAFGVCSLQDEIGRMGTDEEGWHFPLCKLRMQLVLAHRMAL